MLGPVLRPFRLPPLLGSCIALSAAMGLVAVVAAGVWSGTALAAPPSAQQAKLTASDAASGDLFGSSISIDGDTAVVGATGDDDKGIQSGSAYVFVRSGTTWSQQAKLTPGDGAAGDQFGISVGISGETVVIGALEKAYAFVRDGTTWSEQQKLTASDAASGDHFGVSVGIIGDAAFVGADHDDHQMGAVYAFLRTGTTWTEQQKITSLDGSGSDRFGAAVAVSGDRVIIGTGFGGWAYVFVRSGSIWSQQQKLTAGDGAPSVALDGDTAVLGVFGDDDMGIQSGAVYVFLRTGVIWSERQKLTAADGAAGDAFGGHVGISGSTIVVGANGDDGAGSSSGSAYVFEATAAVSGLADLSVSKGDSLDPVMAGDKLTYSVTAMNNGPDTSTNAVLVDVLPPGVTFVSATGSATCMESGGTVSCALGDMANGASTTVDILASVNSMTMGSITNTAGVAGDETDPNATNNTAFETTTVEAVAIQQAKLVASAAAGADFFGTSVAMGGDTVVIGASAGFPGNPTGSADVFVRNGTTWSHQQELTASDASLGNAMGISVGISGDTVVVGASGDDHAGNASGAAYIFVRSGTTWNQQQKLTAIDAAATDFFGRRVAISGETVVVGATADDDAGSASGSAYVFVRSDSTWSQQAKLTAGDAAAGDVFGFVAIDGDTVVIGAVQGDVGRVRTGSAYAFVRSGSSWSEQAKLTGSDSGTNDRFGSSVFVSGDSVVIGSPNADDSGGLSGSAYVFALQQAADLAISKFDNLDPVTPGDELVYSLTVVNNGSGTSTNVRLVDTLPPGVSFVSSTPGSPTCAESGGVITCTLGALATNTSSTVTILVNVPPTTTHGTILTNTAIVTATAFDPNAANNSSTATTTVSAGADLAVAKSDSPDPVLAGTDLTYTLTVTNHGPATSTGAVLTDTLPVGVTFVSSTPPSCEDSVGTVTCDLGALGTGETTTVAIEVAVGPSTRGTLTNTATVSGTETDPNATDNSSTATTTVSAKVDLSISKADSPDPVIAGTVLNYVVTVANAGPSDATGVTVTDVLPAGASYVSATSGQGGCTGSDTITCSLGSLAADASTTVTIQAGVNSSTTGTMTNAASVIGNEPDSNGADNTTTLLTTVNSVADLSVTKQGPPGQVISGTSMSYVLTVTNGGPSDATRVTLTDTLPSGVAYATSSLGSSACVESSGTVTCGLGMIAAGDTASFTIHVNVGSSTTGFITNTVSVTSSATDPGQSDNTATEVTVARVHPDLPSLAQWGLVAMTVILAMTIVWQRRRFRGASPSPIDSRGKGPGRLRIGAVRLGRSRKERG